MRKFPFLWLLIPLGLAILACESWTGGTATTYQHQAIAWSPDGDEIIVGGRLGFWLFDTDLTPLNEPEQWDTGRISNFMVSPDGNQSAYLGQSYYYGRFYESIVIFDLRYHTSHFQRNSFSYGIIALAWSETGEEIAALHSDNNLISIWNMETDDVKISSVSAPTDHTWRTLRWVNGEVVPYYLADEGNFIADVQPSVFATITPTATYPAATSPTLQPTIPYENAAQWFDPPESLWSVDGQWFAYECRFCGEDTIWLLGHVTSENEITVVTQFEDAVYIAFDANGNHFAVIYSDRTELLAFGTDVPLLTMTPRVGNLTAVAFNPTGTLLAGIGYVPPDCSTVWLWDLASGDIIAEDEAYVGPYNADVVRGRTGSDKCKWDGGL